VIFICRVVHLLRMVQIDDYAINVERHLLEITGVSVGRAKGFLFKIGFAYVMLNHWMACIFFMIHRYAERDVALTYVIADGTASFDPVTGEHNICEGFISFCYARSVSVIVYIFI
jgi:hypothetical protein